jgi:hypothetical protein
VMILVLITFLGGAVLGQRCKVLMLLPAIACVLPVAIGVGVAQSGNLWPTLMTVVAAIASLQIGYLAGMGGSLCARGRTSPRASQVLPCGLASRTAPRALANAAFRECVSRRSRQDLDYLGRDSPSMQRRRQAITGHILFPAKIVGKLEVKRSKP